jgi:hypothetical protein
MPWAPDQILAMTRRMATRPQGFRVSAKTAALVVEALRTYGREHCGDPVGDSDYRVDVWTLGAAAIEERMAFVRHLEVAKATYEATLLIRPDKPVTVRE